MIYFKKRRIIIELDNETIQTLARSCGIQIQNLVNLGIEKVIGLDNKLGEHNDFNVKSLYDILQELANNYDKQVTFEETIPNLKKRIKYCKNPMEKKILEKELNRLYKENNMKQYVLVSQGIELFRTFNKQEAEEYRDRENTDWDNYKEKCAENFEPCADNEVFMYEEDI